MKIRSVKAELLHADGRMGGQKNGQKGMKKLIVALRNFPNAPNN